MCYESMNGQKAGRKEGGKGGRNEGRIEENSTQLL
jgi:hypothetical protein